MYYTGCDAHKRSCTFQHIDDDGALGLTMKTVSTANGLNDFLDQLDAPTVMTFEASRGYWWLHQPDFICLCAGSGIKLNIIPPEKC